MIDELTDSPEGMRYFQRARLEGEFTELLSREMKRRKVGKAELARRLGKPASHVRSILSSEGPASTAEMSDCFAALGLSLRLAVRPLSVWTPELEGEESRP